MVLLMNNFLRSLNRFFFRKTKKTRGCDIGLSATSSDEISCGSFTQKFDRAYSTREMKIDSSEEISTDFLHENNTQQSPSYSIKRNEDYIHVDVILKSPSLPAPEEFNDAKIGLKVMKENSPNEIIVVHLNINSLRNKFEALQFIINRNLDIILLSETQLDDSFPSAKFMSKNFGIPYRLDRNSNGGGLLLYVREDIPSKFLKVKSDCNVESICVDVDLRKRKWFINVSYKPNKSFLSNHLECFNRIIDEYSKIFQNFLFLGDFKPSVSEKCLEEFCNVNGITSLIKKATCFKNPDKSTCIDLILTNQPSCFQHSKVFEKKLSGFHLFNSH